MSLYAALKGTGPSGFGYGSTAEQVTHDLDLKGNTYLVTGCNSGLGLETVRVLGLRGGHVVAAARSEETAARALAGAEATGTPVACDLSQPASIRACIESVRRLSVPLHAIVCNAGIMALPKLQQKHGCELQFFTNHIGHFMLVTGLLDRLAPDGRVVVVSSRAHERAPAEGIRFDDLSGETSYAPWAHYGQSKLANLLFARELARRFGEAGTRRTANALHPGVIHTNLARHMNPVARAAFAAMRPLFLKTIAQGAATQCYLATHPAVTASGKYFADCNEARPHPHGEDDAMARRLWDVSLKIVAALP